MLAEARATPSTAQLARHGGEPRLSIRQELVGVFDAEVAEHRNVTGLFVSPLIEGAGAKRSRPGDFVEASRKHHGDHLPTAEECAQHVSLVERDRKRAVRTWNAHGQSRVVVDDLERIEKVATPIEIPLDPFATGVADHVGESFAKAGLVVDARRSGRVDARRRGRFLEEDRADTRGRARDPCPMRNARLRWKM